MLVIRKKQMKILNKYMTKRFEDRIVAHLNDYFHEDCETLGEDKVREVIRHGINRAGSYGILMENHVTKYINLMFAFGPNFDKDPKLPWAREILTKELLLRRMEVLYREAEKHLSEAVRIHKKRKEV